MLLYLAYVWPEPRSSAAGVRTLQVLEAARSLSKAWGGRVGVASAAGNEQARLELEARGFETFSTELNASSFEGLLERLAPKLVVFDRFVTEEQFGARVRRASPEAVRIIDTQDFHALRQARLEGLLGLGSSPKEIWNTLLRTETGLRELASYARSHEVWLVSEFERALFESLPLAAPLVSKVYTVPFGYRAPEQVATIEERRGFVFCGNFRHAPNREALEFLLSEIWPEIYSKLEAQPEHRSLTVYGAYPDAKLLSLIEKTTGANFGGWVEDLGASLEKHRALIAPLKSGAGIKGKILQSLSRGTPVITSSVGAEGIGASDGLSVANEPALVVEQALALLADEARWNVASLSARQVAGTFSDTRCLAEIEARLSAWLPESSARAESSTQRETDWLSDVLWSQTLRSTDYFSRWIELKEKTKRSEERQ